MKENIPRKFSFQLVTSSSDSSGCMRAVLTLLHSCSALTVFAAKTFGSPSVYSTYGCFSVASVQNIDKGSIILKLTLSDPQKHVLMSSAEVYKLQIKLDWFTFLKDISENLFASFNLGLYVSLP